MAEKMHRAQILLPVEQHRAIREIAEREDRSISDVIRDIVQKYLEERKQDERQEYRRQALRELRRIREDIERRYGIYPGDIIAEARTEREKQLEEVQHLEE